MATTVLGLVAVLPAAPAAAREGSPSSGPARADAPVGPAPTRVIIKLRPGLGAAAEDSLLAGLGLRADRVLPLTGAVLADLPPGADAATVAGALSKDARVRYAVPDAWRATAATTGPDPLLGQQWGMHNVGQPIDGQAGGQRGLDVHAQEAWQIAGTGRSQVVVAVLDDGVDVNHPDLKASIFTNTKEIPGNGIDDDHNGCVDDVHGCNVVTGTGAVYVPGDGGEHGTHVAGIIAATADNGIGGAGVAPGVRILPVKFLGASGGYDSDAIAGIAYAQRMGAKIVNASWGASAATDPQAADPALQDAIASSGLLFVAAAGNDGVSNDNPAQASYPAAFALPNLLSVAAVDRNGQLASYSNYGPTTVDLAAPGDQILSTVPPVGTSAYGYLSGTSMAAPFVTGVAALVLSEHPGFTPEQLKARVLASVDPLPSLTSKVVTGGMVDAAAAAAWPGTPVSRLAGADRYTTAADVAGEFPPGLPTAYVATGTDYPDALTGAALAGWQQAPVLLVSPGAVPAPTATALRQLRPGRIVVLGGTGAVSDAVLAALKPFATSGQVTRLGGADRYATAAQVAEQFPVGGPVAYLATGTAFPDALTGAALAARSPGPVLLVAADGVPAATAQALARLQPQQIVVLGGEGAVPPTTLTQLQPYATSGTPVTRLAGLSRYATATAVAAQFTPGVPEVYLASGAAFPDALVGAALAGGQTVPVLLVPPSGPTQDIIDALTQLKTRRVVVLGGAGAVPASSLAAVAAITAPAAR